MRVRSRWDTAPDPDSPTRPDTLGTQAWWLVTDETVGAERLVVNECELPPGTAHQLHRHPNAEQAIIVLSGDGVHVTEEGPDQVVGQGDVVHIPAGEWHGFANPFERPVVIATVYGGVASRGGAGYELHPGPAIDITALRTTK